MPKDDGPAFNHPSDAERDLPPPDLRKTSEDLKTKIAEAKRRNDMPVDSALGNPDRENNASDGHLDIADRDDDD